jgi:hypothetical protein
MRVAVERSRLDTPTNLHGAGERRLDLNDAAMNDPRGLLRLTGEHLVLTWLIVTPLEGRRIDVGEEFEVQLSVRNTLSEGDVFAFVDIEVLIDTNRYVELVGASPRLIGRLDPGQRASEVLRFRALAADERSEGTAEQEPIARMHARARIELAAAQQVETPTQLLRAQIYGSGSPA